MITTSAGEEFTAVLSSAPPGLVGVLGVRIQNTEFENVTMRVTGGITEGDNGNGTSDYTTELTAPSPGQYFVTWDDEETTVREELLVRASGSGGSAFATIADVEDRMGRDLTDTEKGQAESVLAGVSDLIRMALGKTAAWEPDLVPGYFKLLSVEKYVQILANPNNLAAESKQLGAYSHSRTFPRSSDAGLFLSDVEGRAVRFAYYGTDSASVETESVLEDFTQWEIPIE